MAILQYFSKKENKDKDLALCYIWRNNQSSKFIDISKNSNAIKNDFK